MSSLGVPIIITIEDDEKQVSINLTEVIQKHRELNERLLEQMKKQQEYIDQKLEARDQKLIEALNQSLEIRKELTISKQAEKNKKSFRATLFGN
ncbi:hypothetical protein [Bacillus sp. PK3_68]|uniref:hypothetical protein n=1 Tax=Bacillus sp. PK3_68 TaxID=2027408 RepID=UPI000E71EE03|nr:hypothetical protein [Bacillus sp. PK3_68]RJS50258.1 hypothetical protein CJ483_23950 [Bacillus sp. PK3_68]